MDDRPYRWEIEEKFEFYKRAELQEKGSGNYFREDCLEFIHNDMDKDKKNRFYPGWIKEDFEDLLEMIDKK